MGMTPVACVPVGRKERLQLRDGVQSQRIPVSLRRERGDEFGLSRFQGKELLMSWSFMITDVVKNLQFCVRFQWPQPSNKYFLNAS